MSNPPLSYLGSSSDLLVEYLSKRLLEPFYGCESRNVSINNKLYIDHVFLYTFGLDGSIAQIEARSLVDKSYSKLYESVEHIPIYNLQKLFSGIYKNVILCESIFDAESFNQHLNRDDTIAISTNTVSIRKIQELFLVPILKNYRTFTAFDNDRQGRDKSIQFFKLYGWKPLDFRAKDVNEFLVRYKSFSFRSHFNRLLNS